MDRKLITKQKSKQQTKSDLQKLLGVLAVLTSGAGVQRSVHPLGCLPSAGLWPASNQNPSSLPRPGHGSESADVTHKNKSRHNRTSKPSFSSAELMLFEMVEM